MAGDVPRVYSALTANLRPTSLADYGPRASQSAACSQRLLAQCDQSPAACRRFNYGGNMEGRNKTSISDMDALKLNDVWDKKWVIAAKENEKKNGQDCGGQKAQQKDHC